MGRGKKNREMDRKNEYGENMEKGMRRVGIQLK